MKLQKENTETPENLIQVKHPVWGWIKFLFVCFTLPFAIIYYAPVGILQFARVIISRTRKSLRTAGSDSRLSIDETAALVVLPVVSLVSGFGISLSFYLLSISDPASRGISNNGWLVLTGTGEFSVGAIVAYVIVLIRHRSGRDVLPFEKSVDPQQGINQVIKLRRSSSGFFPGVTYSALKNAEQKLEQTNLSEKQQNISFSEVTKNLFVLETDKRQWKVLCVFAVMWVVMPAFWAANYRWLIVILIVLGSLVIILFATISEAASAYYDQYNWGKRVHLLRERMPYQIFSTKDSTMPDNLKADIQNLSREIHMLKEKISQEQRKSQKQLTKKLYISVLLSLFIVRCALSLSGRVDLDR